MVLLSPLPTTISKKKQFSQWKPVPCVGVCNLISIHFRFLFEKPHLVQLLNVKHLFLELETPLKYGPAGTGLDSWGQQGPGQEHGEAGPLRFFTSCLDMSGMTQGYSLHLGSKSEKNLPLARGTLRAHAFQTQNYSVAAAHAASGPAPCLQRAPLLAAFQGPGGS